MFHKTSYSGRISIKGLPEINNCGAVDVFLRHGGDILTCIARLCSPEPRKNGLFGMYCVLRPDGDVIVVYDHLERLVYSFVGNFDSTVWTHHETIDLKKLTGIYLPTEVELIVGNVADDVVISFIDQLEGKKVSVDLHVTLRYEDKKVKSVTWSGYEYTDNKPQHKPNEHFMQPRS